MPFSPLLLSTYCISELLRIYLAPPCLLQLGKQWRDAEACMSLTVSAPFSITTYEHARRREGWTTGLFFLERSPIY